MAAVFPLGWLFTAASMIALGVSGGAWAQSATPVPVNAVGSVGTVLSSGAWTHTVGLELPPAPGGMKPSLALVADHRVQDGPLGVGWRLDGFSRIERRSEFGGVPRFDGADTFWLDGMRLWPDTSTLTSGDYRLEKDDNRVFYHREESNRWDVYRDGWWWRYGEWGAVDAWRGRCATEHQDEDPATPCDTNPGQALLASASTTGWLLATVSDPSSNKIHINYTSGQPVDTTASIFGGDHLYTHVPAEVGYADGYVRISLEYTTRPDVRVDARSGRLRKMPLRLHALQIYADAKGSAPVADARYELVYLDAETEACPGGEELPDPLEVDLEAASVLHRVVRADALATTRRTVRCIETDSEATVIETADTEILPSTFTGLDAPAISLVNFDGDPWLEVLATGYSGCALDSDADDLSGCMALAYAWRRAGTGDLVRDSALEAALASAHTDDFVNCDGRTFVADVNRDGATDILFAAGATCDYGATENTQGVLWGIPGDVPNNAVSSASFSLSATEMEDAQFVDIDADGFVDILLPDPASGYTTWIRNDGDSSPFEGAAEVLDIPLEDPTTASGGDLADAQAECMAGGLEFELWPSSMATELYDFDGVDDYVRSMARWGDYNGDGVIDVAYAFWSCWEEVGDDADPAAGFAVSHLFYGDGDGAFHEGPTGVGPPGWGVQREVWSDGSTFLDPYVLGGLVDLDRSGRPELIHAPDVTGAVAELNASMGLGAPGLFGYDGDVGVIEDCPHATCEDTQLPVEFLAASWLGASATNALVDWDGDTFPDVVQLYASSGENLMVSWYENQRTVARHRITKIHEAWGGMTSLTWTASALAGANEALPYAVEVIETVDGENGLTRFGFEGGYAHEGRFMGFAEAWIQYASGRTASARFAQALPFAGDLVSRTEYRADGTIETFTFTSPLALESGSSVISLDGNAPFFNPTRRRCEFHVGPGSAYGGTVIQTVDEEELAALCVQWDGGPTFWANQWTAAMGWDRDSEATADIQDAVWAEESTGGDYTFAGEAGPAGAWPDPAWNLPDRSEYPGLLTDVPGVLPVPTSPPLAVVAGAATTDVDMYATGWEYTAKQRVSNVHEWRDVDTSADDVHQVLTRDAYASPAHGEQLTATRWEDRGGALLREVVRSDFAAFDLPRTVSERGATGPARYWYYTYSNGDALTVQDPDLASTTYTRNKCGQVTKRTDPVGRDEERTYSTACRESTWSWEGAFRTTSYDALGRTLEEVVEAGGLNAAPVVERWYRDDDIDVTDFVASWIADPTDRGEWDEPRAAVVRDDTLRLLYLDRWGRQVLEVRCEEGPGIASDVSSILTARACVPGSEVYAYRGYADDGTLRVETRPWASGEVPAGTFGYRDVFGRVEEVLAPAPIEVSSGLDADWVQTSFTYEPGRVEVKDPLDRTCVALSDTMGGERWCEGAFRGSFERDVLGNVVEEVDGASVATKYTYDEFQRLETRSLVGGVVLHDGSVVTPTWTLDWSAGGRLDSVEDPAGNVRSWWYDSAGRVTSAWFDPVSEPAKLLGVWSWYDHSGMAGTRRVLNTDVNGYLSAAWLDGLDRTWKRVHPDGTDEQWTWDAGGELSRYEDIDGGQTLYTRLATGEVITETDAPTGATRDWVYNGAGLPVEATDRDDVVTTYGWTWDGRPAWEDRGGWTTSSWTWRDDGRLVERWEGGVATTYDYDALGRRTSACVGRETDGSCGLELGWAWTANDQLYAETRAVPTESVFQTKYTRNALGWVTGVEHPDLTAEAWGYDILGRVRSYQDESGYESEWTWDDWGRPLTEDLPDQQMRYFSYSFGSASPEVHEVLEPDGGEWSTSYDFAGRAVAETYPDGIRLERVFEGSQLLEVWHKDAGGNDLAVESLEYDSLGRVAARWGPVDAGVYTRGDWTSGDYVFQYSWTDEGRILSVVGPKDETHFTWGTDGLLSAEEVVGVTTHTYAYDDIDYPRVTGITTSDGIASRTVTRDWERGMWLESETATQGSESLVKSFGGWDAYGTPRSAVSLHGPTGSETAMVAYDMATDARGRMSVVDIAMDSGWTGEVTYAWENDGAIDTVTTTWAGSLDYSYNPGTGWLTGITDGSTTLATFPMTERDDLGRPTWVNLANGGHIEASWDQNGRVSSWDVENATGVTEARDYLYDDRGRLEGLDITRASGTRSDTYTYEEPGWLAIEERAEGTWSETVQYDYDAAGNRSRRIVDGLPEPLNTYGTGNVLTAVGTDSVTWDGLGGITGDHRGFEWERYPDGSELALLGTGGATLHHITRDAFGRPVAVDDGVSAAAYTTIWGNPGGDWPLAGEDENGEPVLWVAAEGILVGQVRDGVAVEAASGPDGSLLLLDTQFLGSPGAWGDETGAHPVGPGATERYVYAGLQSLPGTPFALARQRAYDPTMGRFTSADPIGLAGGDNRFGYANGDPLGFVDPEGLSAIDAMGRTGFSTPGTSAGGGSATSGFWDSPDTTFDDPGGKWAPPVLWGEGADEADQSDAPEVDFPAVLVPERAPGTPEQQAGGAAAPPPPDKFRDFLDGVAEWFSGEGTPNADEIVATLLADTGDSIGEGAKGYWGQLAVNRVRSYSDQFESHSYEHMGGLALQDGLDESCRSTACQVGQVTADVVTTVGGVVEVGVGAVVVGGSVTGGGLVSTGGVTAPVGAVIAVEGAVLGAAVAADGVAVAAQGISSAQEHGRALISKMEKAGASAPGAAKGAAQAGRTAKLAPADSKIWKSFETAGGGRRTSGAGKSKRYYEWDHTHGDIEVYDSRGRHLGSMDPTSGEMTKPPVSGRTIDL